MMISFVFAVFGVCFVVVSHSSNIRPCVFGEDPISGCLNRIRPCSYFVDHPVDASVIVIKNSASSDCKTNVPRLRDTVQTRKNNRYLVQFDDKDGTCYGIEMDGGECWGRHPVTNDDFNCLGRCGGGCNTSFLCSNWARDCLKHDVCSYYFGSTEALLNEHCSDEWRDASDDWGTCCLRVCPAKCSYNGAVNCAL